MRLIDTHCHIHDPGAFPDPEQTIRQALSAGVERIIVVGTGPEDWSMALEFAHGFDQVNAIVGWHPNYTATYRGDLEDLRQALQNPKVLALGEIGLDYHWDYSPPTLQKQALNDQLDLATELDTPVVFHAREAYGDLLDILEARAPHPYLFHCWAGNAEQAQRAVKLDAYFGVDGPITYKKADDLRSVIAALPRERIVLETDSPYMSPVPHRGKLNQPAYVDEVNKGLAAALGVSEEDCARLTTENAERFFWRNE